MNQGDNNQKKFSINPDNGEVNQSEISQPNSVFEEHGTFCRVGSTTGGILEVDLRSMKSKGVEERYISFKVMGFNEQNEVIPSEMFLLDETQFKKLKEFISKLNWND
jgi:translation elongation factor EF-4